MSCFSKINYKQLLTLISQARVSPFPHNVLSSFSYNTRRSLTP